MKTLFFLLILGLSAAEARVEAQVSVLGDTLHLEFSGLSQWNYDLKKNNTKTTTEVEIRVPALSAQATEDLKAFRSSDVKKIEVDSKGPDGSYVVKLSLNSASFDVFDYLTDQPSRLVIDIFQATEKSKAKPKASAANESKETDLEVQPTKVVAKASLPKSGQRKPATTDILKINNMPGKSDVSAPDKRSGVFDGADPGFDRFSIQDFEIKEESILASHENVYIQFPMLRIPSPDFGQINANRPFYEISPKDSDENKQARLLLTLFNNKRYNVFLKTVEWFTQKYPKSEYDEIVRFMWADTLFNLWLEKRDVNDFDLAMLRYRKALESYPNSPLTERTQMLMGYATLDRGDYLGTLRLFQAQLKTRPQSPFRDRARFGVADSFLKLSRFDEALQQYQEIEKDASSESAKREAAYLAGDVHFEKKDFAQAITDYQAAEKKYPDGKTTFPNATYNQAASLFELKDFRKSLESYKEFLKKFPSHEYAGYAMTRVAELLDILGADKTRVMGAYLETYFRYGDSPSAIVARLRMLSSRMKGMKPKEVEKAVKDIGELAKQSNLPGIEQFATLMISEGFSKRGEYDQAIERLVKFYQEHPTDSDTKMLSQKIVKNINDKIADLTESKKFIDALRTHNQYADSWLKSSQRIDTKFNIARSFEQAGVPKQAETIYKDNLNKLYAIRGTASEKEKAVIEKLPTEDRLNLRLAAVSAQMGKWNQAYDDLKNIKKPESLTELEQIERVQLAANLLERRGDLESGARYLVELIKTWKGLPELVAEPYADLADLELKQGKTQDAIKSFEKVDELMVDSGKVSTETHAKSLEKLGNLYLEKNQKDQAISTYQKLLDKYEGSRPLESMRYKLGQIYFQNGDIQKASDVWKKLEGKKQDLWSRLAQEQLKNANWRDDYKKYIQRIPAMSEREKP